MGSGRFEKDWSKFWAYLWLGVGITLWIALVIGVYVAVERASAAPNPRYPNLLIHCENYSVKGYCGRYARRILDLYGRNLCSKEDGLMCVDYYIEGDLIWLLARLPGWNE